MPLNIQFLAFAFLQVPISYLVRSKKMKHLLPVRDNDSLHF